LEILFENVVKGSDMFLGVRSFLIYQFTKNIGKKKLLPKGL